MAWKYHGRDYVQALIYELRRQAKENNDSKLESFAKFLERYYKMSEAERTAVLLRRLFKLSKAVKMNCLYSEKEMVKDVMMMDRFKADKEEKDALMEAWELRRQLGKKLVKQVKELVEELKELEDKEVEEVGKDGSKGGK